MEKKKGEKILKKENGFLASRRNKKLKRKRERDR